MSGILSNFDPHSKMEDALNVVVFERRPYIMGYPGKRNDSHEWDKSVITRIGRGWHITLLERGLASFIRINQQDEQSCWHIDLTEEGKALLDANGFTKGFFERTVKDEDLAEARRAIRKLFQENGL